MNLYPKPVQIAKNAICFKSASDAVVFSLELCQTFQYSFISEPGWFSEILFENDDEPVSIGSNEPGETIITLDGEFQAGNIIVYSFKDAGGDSRWLPATQKWNSICNFCGSVECCCGALQMSG